MKISAKYFHCFKNYSFYNILFRISSLESTLPCEQVQQPAGKWNQMVEETCILQSVSVIPRLHDEASSTSWLVELASSCKHHVKLASRASFMKHSWSIHEAGFIVKRLSSQLIELARQASSSSQLVELASSCKRGITEFNVTFSAYFSLVWNGRRYNYLEFCL